LKRVATADDVPASTHYAIIVYKTHTVHHEGDERSRTNTGHGYLAYDERVETFEHFVTLDKADWIEKATQLELERNKRTYEAFTFVCLVVARKAEVKHKVEVSLG
jgi:hypothetical protein